MLQTIKTIFLVALSIALSAVVSGCPTSPDTEREIQNATKVPGLDEAVLAKDRAIEAAIKVVWKSDVELMQEQLAVEEVTAGKVRITGIVSRPELKEKAEKLAKTQEGVVDVVSTITVDESLKDKRINMDDF